MQTANAITKVTLALMLLPTTALAQAVERAQDTARDTGVSAIWLLANLSYAGMRAQDSSSGAWRIISFIFGFPGTLLTFLAVPEGGQRAYGVDLPRRVDAERPEPAEIRFVERDR